MSGPMPPIYGMRRQRAPDEQQVAPAPEVVQDTAPAPQAPPAPAQRVPEGYAPQQGYIPQPPSNVTAFPTNYRPSLFPPAAKWLFWVAVTLAAFALLAFILSEVDERDFAPAPRRERRRSHDWFDGLADERYDDRDRPDHRRDDRDDYDDRRRPPRRREAASASPINLILPGGQTMSLPNIQPPAAAGGAS